VFGGEEVEDSDNDDNEAGDEDCSKDGEPDNQGDRQ